MRGLLAVLGLLICTGAARAEGERAGDFDYYVMALSWSANWCALEGDARGEDQCLPGKRLTFTLHGLWPQNETGWPSYCRTGKGDPSRAESRAMADIMGGAGLAWYQWKKHGRCSGLSPQEFYATSRKAYASVRTPQILKELKKTLTLPASVMEAAFLEVNPEMTRDMVTVTCAAGMIQEVRICLTKDLEPRRCGTDAIKDCTLKDALLHAVR